MKYLDKGKELSKIINEFLFEMRVKRMFRKRMKEQQGVSRLGLIPVLGLAMALGNVDAEEVERNIAGAFEQSRESIERTAPLETGTDDDIILSDGIVYRLSDKIEGAKKEEDAQKSTQSDTQILGEANASTFRQAISFDKKEDRVQEIMSNVRVNENGKVVGIDVSQYLSAQDLRRILTTDGLPSRVYDEKGTEHNIEDLSGKVDYVIIKIGARSFQEDGHIVDVGDEYIKQARVCEELGIPYGFYFYSAAISEGEATEEVELVKHQIEVLQDSSSTEYFMLPVFVDVEQQKGSRLSGKDVTDIAAHWINTAEEELGRSILLYTGGRDAAGPEKIVDIKRLNSQLNNGPARIWTTGPRTPDGRSVGPISQSYINTIVAEGGDIVMIQAILDQTNPEVGLPKTDVDIMDSDVFEEMLRDGSEVGKQTDEHQASEEIEGIDTQDEQQDEEVPLEQKGLLHRIIQSIGKLFHGKSDEKEDGELLGSTQASLPIKDEGEEFRKSLRVSVEPGMVQAASQRADDETRGEDESTNRPSSDIPDDGDR